MTEQQQLEEMMELLQRMHTELRAELDALRQDVHTILEHMPMQQIPADPDAEVQ